jgi:hypothetical protein
MNYRRGFQRVYAVLTVVWIAIVLFTVISGRWEPWLRLHFHQGMASLEDIVPDQSNNQFDQATVWREGARQRWVWALGLSLIPPVVLYLLLFYVALWIYRGFRPGTHF